MTTRSRLTLGAALLSAAALLATGLAGNAGAAEPLGSAPLAGQPSALSPTERGALLQAAHAERATTARQLGLGAKEQLVVRDVVQDHDGTTHTRYERTYDGLPVLGGDLVVHTPADGGAPGVTRATEATIAVASTRAPAAARPATASAEGSSAPRQVIWAADGDPVLAWERVVGGVQEDGVTPSRLHEITDAATGAELFTYQEIRNGTGNSMYSGEVEIGTLEEGGQFTLTDTERGGHQTFDLKGGQSGQGTLFTNGTDTWGSGDTTDPATAGVDAHYGAAATWDYFLEVHQRSGIRDDGEAAHSRVHYGDNYANAFWDDSCFCMTYGDGDGNEKPLTSLDVAAHEMTHGVTSSTARLVYSGESGGLNEATSDIFAAGVEFHADSPDDPADYQVGEKIDLFGDGSPLRHMDQPSKDGSSLDYWDEDADSVDVHYSSGIANHFFYLLAEGSGAKEINGVSYDSPTADGSTLEGIGLQAAERIWFTALVTYMTSTTDYHDARDATLQAATDLFGTDSAEVEAVGATWTAVGVS